MRRGERASRARLAIRLALGAYWAFCAIAAGAPGVAGAAAPAPAEAIVGTWEGKLAGRIRFILHVERGPSGELTATADSPDQNAMGLEVNSIAVIGDTLSFIMEKLNGAYGGRFNADRTEIAGTWRQGGASLLLVLKPATAGGASPAAGRPQEPKPPFPYNAIEVSFPNKDAKAVTLAGTLTVPQTGSKFPCAVLITGSGTQDRDETIFGHKPFLILADYLTRHGIAVLRTDDRGAGGSVGPTDGVTSDDFASDVRAAVAFLRTRKEIDPARIGLIGHSEGGLIAPMVAVKDPKIAFVVLLAGPGVPGDSILISQSYSVSKSMGFPDSTALSAQNAQRDLITAAKASPDSAALVAKLKTVITAQIARLPEEQRKGLDDIEELAAGQAQILRAPWMQFFLSHDPRPVLEQVKCPILALNGERDIQILATQNLPAIREALLKGGNKDATVEALPRLNHLFQTSITGGIAEYQTNQETFSPVALQKIGGWIGARMARGK